MFLDRFFIAFVCLLLFFFFSGGGEGVENPEIQVGGSKMAAT